MANELIIEEVKEKIEKDVVMIRLDRETHKELKKLCADIDISKTTFIKVALEKAIYEAQNKPEGE